MNRHELVQNPEGAGNELEKTPVTENGKEIENAQEDAAIETISKEIENAVEGIEEINSVVLDNKEEKQNTSLVRFFNRARAIKEEAGRLVSEMQESIAARRKEKKLEGIYHRVFRGEPSKEVSLTSLQEIYSGIGSDTLQTPREIREFIREEVVRPHVKEALQENDLAEALHWYELSATNDEKSDKEMVGYFSREALKKDPQATPRKLYETGISLLGENPRMLMRFLSYMYSSAPSSMYEEGQRESVKQDVVRVAEENKHNPRVLKEIPISIFAFDELTSPELKRAWLMQNGLPYSRYGVLFIDAWKVLSPEDRMDVIEKTVGEINASDSGKVRLIGESMGYLEFHPDEFAALLKGVNRVEKRYRRITAEDVGRNSKIALLTNKRVLKCSPDAESRILSQLSETERFDLLDRDLTDASSIEQKKEALYFLQSAEKLDLNEKTLEAIALGMATSGGINFLASFCTSGFFTSAIREDIVSRILKTEYLSANSAPAVFDELLEKIKNDPDTHVRNMGERLFYRFGSKEGLRHRLTDVIQGAECADRDALVAAYVRKEGSWELAPEFIEMFVERDLLDMKYAPEFLSRMRLGHEDVMAEKMKALQVRDAEKYDQILSLAEKEGSGSVLALGLREKFFDPSRDVVDRIINGSIKEKKGSINQGGVLSLIESKVIPLGMAVDSTLEVGNLYLLGGIARGHAASSSDDRKVVFEKVRAVQNVETRLFLLDNAEIFRDFMNQANFVPESEDIALQQKNHGLILALLREKNNSGLKLGGDFFERVIRFGTEAKNPSFIVGLLKVNAKEFNPSEEVLKDLFSSIEQKNEEGDRNGIVQFMELYFTDNARYKFLDKDNEVQRFFEKTAKESMRLSEAFLDNFLDPADGWYKDLYGEREGIPDDVLKDLLSTALQSNELSKKFYTYGQCAEYFKSVLGGQEKSEDQKDRKKYLIKYGMNKADPSWLLEKKILTSENFVSTMAYAKERGIDFPVKRFFDVYYPEMEKFKADLLKKLDENSPDEVRYELQKALSETKETGKLFESIGRYDGLRMKHVAAGEFIGSLFSRKKTGQEMPNLNERERKNFEEMQSFVDAHRSAQSDFGLTIVALIGAREYDPELTLEEYLEKMVVSLRRYQKLISSWDGKKVPETIRASIGMEYEVTTSTGKAYQETSGRAAENDFIEFNEFARIGRGRDGVYEIATQVADNPYLVLAQMDLLQELDFIDLNFKKEGYEKGARGMHLTIGGASGIRNDENSNLLHNLLIMSNWGGVNAGKDIKGASRGRPYVMRPRAAFGGEDFWAKTGSVEMRSLSIDKWEPFERTLSTAYCGAVAIQAIEKYTTKINPSSFDFEAEKFPQDEKELYEIFKEKDLLARGEGSPEHSFDEHVWKSIYAWVRMMHDVKEAVKKHNGEFLERETYGYLDKSGAWVDAKDFGGEGNKQRFSDVAKTLGHEDVDTYVEGLKIKEADLFSEVTPQLINACSGIANLYLKPSKELGGDVANAAAMFAVTKVEGKIESDSFEMVEKTPFEQNKERRGYYSLQGASEEMIIHAIQRALLAFRGRMEETFAFQ